MKRVTQNQLRAAALCAFGLGAFGTAEAAIEIRADFNNDGFEDLAIGVPGEGIQDPALGDLRAAGAVNVIYGTAAGLSASGNQVWFQNLLGESSDFEDNFGAALATGDFNGDKFADLAIAAPREDFGISTGLKSDAGIVHILYGSATGLSNANALIRIRGASPAPGRHSPRSETRSPPGISTRMASPTSPSGCLAKASGSTNGLARWRYSSARPRACPRPALP